MLITLARWALIPLFVAFVVMTAECIRYWYVHRDRRPAPYDWAAECPDLVDPEYPPHHVHPLPPERTR